MFTLQISDSFSNPKQVGGLQIPMGKKIPLNFKETANCTIKDVKVYANTHFPRNKINKSFQVFSMLTCTQFQVIIGSKDLVN